MTIDNISHTTSLIEEALMSYGQGIHHGKPIAQHIAAKLAEEGLLDTPEPEPLKEWSDDLSGTWAESPAGRLLLLLWGEGKDIYVWGPDYEDYSHRIARELTPRPDLAPVDLTPRKVEGES